MRIAEARHRERLAGHLPFVAHFEWDASPARAHLCRQGACSDPTDDPARLSALLHETDGDKGAS